MINLEGDVQVTESNTGLVIESIRELVKLPPQVVVAGVSGCGKHFKTIENSAYIPRGTPLVRWEDTSSVKQVSKKPP